MVLDGLRGYLQLASGLTDVTRERALAAAKAVATQGEAGVDAVVPAPVTTQVSTLTDDLLAASKANRDLLLHLVRAEVERSVARLGLVSAHELEPPPGGPRAWRSGSPSSSRSCGKSATARKAANTRAKKATTKKSAKKTTAKKSAAKKSTAKSPTPARRAAASSADPATTSTSDTSASTTTTEGPGT